MASNFLEIPRKAGDQDVEWANDDRKRFGQESERIPLHGALLPVSDF